MAYLRYIATGEKWNGETIDGVRHPQSIRDLWSASELAQIGLEAYTPPVDELGPVDPLTVPLTGVQFAAMLALSGKRQAVYDFINAIPDATQKEVALAKVEHSLSFDRSDDLFSTIGPSVGLTDAEIDALWVQALEIS